MCKDFFETCISEGSELVFWYLINILCLESKNLSLSLHKETVYNLQD